MRLYTFFRSSAAYRVRIALAVKGLAYQSLPLHLRRDGGEHRKPQYLARNPQGLVPALEVGTALLTQSLAIIEYLEEIAPTPPLLPADPLARARIRAMAFNVACDIHPLNNLRVLEYLREPLGLTDDAVKDWYAHWIAEGFRGLERLAERQSTAGRHMFGDSLTLADVCIVPQVYNARRFHCDLAPYPALVRIDAHLTALPEFAAAHPDRQPDAEP